MSQRGTENSYRQDRPHHWRGVSEEGGLAQLSSPHLISEHFPYWGRYEVELVHRHG